VYRVPAPPTHNNKIRTAFPPRERLAVALRDDGTTVRTLWDRESSLTLSPVGQGTEGCWQQPATCPLWTALLTVRDGETSITVYAMRSP